MTILSSDIRLLESERMTDTTDGGGRRTNRVIPDGQPGNIFPKVSRVDSVYGRVNLRKIYPHINTANLDVYAGAHFVITDAPDNDRIGVLAFSTGSDFDLRTAARDRIESYVIAGPESRMTLYGRQLKEAQAILAYQREEEPLPEIGDVYAISNEVGGVTTAQQFVRVQDVTHEVRTFADDSNGEYRRRVVTIKIGTRLRHEFAGIPAPSRFASVSASAAGKLRTTTVADAARYYGIQPLSAAVSSGALELSVASVYAPIVPTTQRETPLSLASVAGAAFGLDCASVAVNEPTYSRVTGATNFVYRTALPIKPGTLVIADGYTSVDNGAGGITSSANNNGYVGTVDYESGTLTLTALNAGNYPPIAISYVPQAYVSQAAHAHDIPVTLATRGTVYSVPLLPLPAPGTLIVDFRALGKWYRLRDNGAGELVGGDAQYGTGTVNYVTGGATITLGALPDVGSSVLLSWGSPVHYEVRTSDAGAAYQDFTLPLSTTVAGVQVNATVKANTLSIAFVSGGVTHTIAASGAALSGGGVTGTLDPVTGAVHIDYGTHLPDFDSILAVSYTTYVIDPVQPAPEIISGAAPGTPVTIPSTVSPSAARRVSQASTESLSFDMGEPVVADSFTATINVSLGGSTREYLLKVNGLTDGTLRGYASPVSYIGPGAAAASPFVSAPANLGTINAATGVITVTATSLVLASSSYDDLGGVWVNGTATVSLSGVAGRVNTFNYSASAITVPEAGEGGADIVLAAPSLATIDTPRTVPLDVASDAPIRLNLTSTSTSTIVAGSLMFSMAGKTFIDRNGTLYADIEPATGSGMAAGTIDYASGIATPTFWARGAAPAVAVKSCLVTFGDFTATAISFRTAGSPIRPASLYVQVTALDGELLVGAADQSGNITGGMTGVVEQTMGVVNVAFAKSVLPGTLRYSAVVLSNLPLDADILGLDPVRLPTDGRVPIFRPADVAVVHHTDIYNAGTPAAGSTISVGRTDLSALWLEDSNKKKLAAGMYAVDLAAGTATMAADLSLTGYAPPIAAKHRIEEMGLLSDVQINGQLTLTAPLLRAFPAGSQLSSALLYGDLQARVTNVFDQQTWTGVWQSTRIGDGATAQYNDVDYPIEVLNNGAITERWRLHFTTTTSYQVIGENLGVIGTGTTGADLQIVNPLTGLPYFTLRFAGFGLGWPVGGNLRFDTIAAAPPTWLARCVLPGAALTGDSFDAQLRGDVD